ncbi:MAG: PTS glucose transporter subunit IIA [Micropruina sp.]
MVALTDVNDKVFASKALGDGVGIVPSDGHVVARWQHPGAVADSGHAFGVKTDDGVCEVLVHVGIDTVQLEEQGPCRRGQGPARRGR